MRAMRAMPGMRSKQEREAGFRAAKTKDLFFAAASSPPLSVAQAQASRRARSSPIRRVREVVGSA